MMLCVLIQSGGASVVAAMIATIVAALGWLGKSILGGTLHYLAIWGAEVERLVALKAEMTMNLVGQEAYARDNLVSDLKARYMREPGYQHFIPLFRENVVFDNIKKDITRLPKGPLEGVVDYYKASGDLDAVLASLETARYEALSIDRKVDIYNVAVESAKALSKHRVTTLVTIDDEIQRRQYYRAMLASLTAGFAIVVLAICFSAVEGLQNFTRCQPPQKTASSTGDLYQINGGRIGGFMMSSPI